jgi:hypothetical protein
MIINVNTKRISGIITSLMEMLNEEELMQNVIIGME